MSVAGVAAGELPPGGQLALPFPEAVAPPSDPAELERRAREETDLWLARAVERWPRADGPIRVSFALRGRTGGDACARTGTVRYNIDLLHRHGDDFLREIVPHEVAHLVAARAFPGRKKPHGAEWKAVMAHFGVPARACHRFETTPSRAGQRFAYKCLCPEPHLLTPVAHRRIRRGIREYHCRRCGFALVWTGPVRERDGRRVS